MSSLSQALEAGAKVAYGEDWESLNPIEQMHVREAVIPIMNAMLPHLQEALAHEVDLRVEVQMANGRSDIANQLRRAADDLRRWPA